MTQYFRSLLKITNNNAAQIQRFSLCTVFAFILFVMPSGAQQDGRVGVISGTVFERESGTPLPGATVQIVDTNKGAIVNSEGRYTIEGISAGLYNVKYSMIGYQSLVKTNVNVRPGRATEVSVFLEAELVEVEGATIKGKSTYFEKDPEAEVSGRTIDTQEIETSSGGMNDIQRVVQILPSVTSGTDQMNEIIVRGGNFNENLFVMDGIDIPNPNHFSFQGTGGGVFPLLRTEFIRDVSFLAGAFPAKYGDKASSVMDISLRRGSREDYLTTLDMSMAGAGAMSEGPVGDNGSFMVSARRSYFDLLVREEGMTTVPTFYNFQGKLTYTVGKHTLMFNGVHGSDIMELHSTEETEEELEGNFHYDTNVDIAGLTVRSAHTENLFTEAVVSYVSSDWYMRAWNDATVSDDFNNTSTETENTGKLNVSYLLGPHEISGGVQVKNSRFDHNVYANGDTIYTYDTSFPTAREDTVNGVFMTYPSWDEHNKVSTYKNAAYGQLRVVPVDRLTLRLGGRYDHLEYTGHGHLAPRLGARFRLTDTVFLNSAYGIHYQSPQYLLMTANEGNRDLKNYYSEQTVLGTEWLPRPDTRVTLEGYTKRYHDIPISKSSLTADPFDDSEGLFVNAGRGHSEGIELYVQRKMSTSYMYVLSYSTYRAFFEDPRTGKERPWDFDHRHLFTVSGTKKWRLSDKQWYRDMREKLWYKLLGFVLPFGDEVLLSSRWRYAGGRPYTKQTYRRDIHMWYTDPSTPMNNGRMPAYHRLDLRLDRRYYYDNWSLVYYIDIMNVYGRDNIWDYSRNEYGEIERISQFSTLPVGGFQIEF